MLVCKMYNEPTQYGSLVINEAVFPEQQATHTDTLGSTELGKRSMQVDARIDTNLCTCAHTGCAHTHAATQRKPEHTCAPFAIVWF